MLRHCFCHKSGVRMKWVCSWTLHSVSLVIVYSCDNTTLFKLLSSFIISPGNWQHKFFSFAPQNCLGCSWPFVFPYNVLKISLSRSTNVPRRILIGSLMMPRIRLGRNNIIIILSILMHEIVYAPLFINVFFNLSVIFCSFQCRNHLHVSVHLFLSIWIFMLIQLLSF